MFSFNFVKVDLKVLLKVSRVGDYEHTAHGAVHLEFRLTDFLHHDLSFVKLVLAELLLADTGIQLLKSSSQLRTKFGDLDFTLVHCCHYLNYLIISRL